MEVWIAIAIVILVSALAVDRTRAYRVLPALLNRLRGRPPAGRRKRRE